MMLAVRACCRVRSSGRMCFAAPAAPRDVKRLVEADEPPRYERAAVGSMLDPLEPVITRLMKECPKIRAPRVTETLRDGYGYVGSVDLVRRRMAELRPPSSERVAQRTGYRPGQVMQVDWSEMPTRPRSAGRERRVYASICSLPFSGASTARFSFDMTIASFLEGHVRAFDWLGGVPRECAYDNLRSTVARRDGDVVTWNPRFVQLRGHDAFHATAYTPGTPREKGSVEARSIDRIGLRRSRTKRSTAGFRLAIVGPDHGRANGRAPASPFA
jgi:transposase